MSRFKWECPYCHVEQIASPSNVAVESGVFRQQAFAPLHPYYRLEAIACINDDCRRVNFRFVICNGRKEGSGFFTFDEGNQIYLKDIFPEYEDETEMPKVSR